LADGTLVINLDDRPERMTRIEELTVGQPHLSGWQRLPAVLGSRLGGFGNRPWFRGRKRDKAWAGRAGCVLSHRKAIETALNAGWNRVCILEDDVDFPQSFTPALDATISWLAAHEEQWQIAYLGFTEPAGPCQKLAGLTATRAVYRISGCATTHAYLLKREAMLWILNQLPVEAEIWPWLARHRAIDRWYSRHLARRFPVVAISPSLIGQVSDFSDIGQRNAGDERAGSFYDPIPSRLVVNSRAAHAVKSTLRNVRIAVLNRYDQVRSWRKHRNGF
jgi:GR25 family glycosyltransferase involved in LPS biosynthesis